VNGFTGLGLVEMTRKAHPGNRSSTCLCEPLHDLRRGAGVVKTRAEPCATRSCAKILREARQFQRAREFRILASQSVIDLFPGGRVAIPGDARRLHRQARFRCRSRRATARSSSISFSCSPLEKEKNSLPREAALLAQARREAEALKGGAGRPPRPPLRPSKGKARHAAKSPTWSERMAQLMAEEAGRDGTPETEDAPLRIDRFGRHPRRPSRCGLLRVFFAPPLKSHPQGTGHGGMNDRQYLFTAAAFPHTQKGG